MFNESVVLSACSAPQHGAAPRRMALFFAGTTLDLPGETADARIRPDQEATKNIGEVVVQARLPG